MAKVRKLRQKYTASLAKKSKPETKSTYPKDVFKRKMDSFLQKDHKVTSLDKLSKIISKKNNLRKNEKRLHRRKVLLKKIDILSKDQKEKTKRSKTVITGDLKPLAEALPTLTELLSETKNRRSRPTEVIPNAKRLKNSEKKVVSRQQDIQTFNKVLHHSAFQQSPFDSITAYLKNKISTEN